MIVLTVKGAILIAVLFIVLVMICLWLPLYLRGRRIENVLNHIVGKIGP